MLYGNAFKGRPLPNTLFMFFYYLSINCIFMKKLLSIMGIALVAISVIPTSVFATDGKNDNRGNAFGKIKIANENTVKVSEKINLKRPQLRTIAGTVTVISGTNITMVNKDTTYTVDTTGAKFVRRFGAAMVLGDIQVNDQLSVWGTVDGTTLKALYIRDMSLQAFHGEFSGVVKSIDASSTFMSFVLTTKNRNDQTIYTVSSTVFKKNGVVILPSAVQVGSEVRVDGVWDRVNANVMAKTVVLKLETRPVEISGTVTVSNGSIVVVTRNNLTYSADTTHTLFVGKDFHLVSAADVKTGDSVTVHAIRTNQSMSVIAYLVRDLSL